MKVRQTSKWRTLILQTTVTQGTSKEIKTIHYQKKHTFSSSSLCCSVESNWKIKNTANEQKISYLY